ncbi:hypothetical protein BASA81_003995 [Batrachochytrium salamandrivorans]|nr:hypothetical protein BASA81_003995 [Batrachochytrium salamandrivorans]
MSSLEELDEIERQIAALEGEIGSSEESGESESEDELQPIPKLPTHLVCAPGMLLGVARTMTHVPLPPLPTSTDALDSDQEATEPKPATETVDKKRIECKVCDNSVCWGEDAFRKHSRTVKHRQNVILKAGETYEAANKASNFCRACNFTASETEELMKHRQTLAHREAASALARASTCQLCRKQSKRRFGRANTFCTQT